jgi:hypothetical protein
MTRVPLRLAAAIRKDGTPVLRLSEAWEFFQLPGGSL